MNQQLRRAVKELLPGNGNFYPEAVQMNSAADVG